MAEKLLLRNTQSPGDYVVLSAAVRDLHRAYPGRFEVMVEVPQPAVYQSNPYVKGFVKNSPTVRTIVAKYPAIHTSNQRKGIHFMWGFIEYLNTQLKTNIVLTEFKPDLHLTPEEMANPPSGVRKPYWVFVSGGKDDYTAKWWDPACWQQVVDRMVARGVQMVQVGGGSHKHPGLQNTHDLVGKTSFRELMRLIYHSDGVLCIVTCLMHIAAAFNRPCVVVAGGREPWWWEAYNLENRLTNMRKGVIDWKPPEPDNFIPHQYLHTIGQLHCCKTGGCWKSRISGKESVCGNLAQQNSRTLPRCLQMITPDMVYESADWYYKNGLVLHRTVEYSAPPPVAAPVIEKELTGRLAILQAGENAAHELKKAVKESTSRWLAWIDPRYPVALPQDWSEKVIARMEQRQAGVGGLYCWRLAEEPEAKSIGGEIQCQIPKHPLSARLYKAHYFQRGLVVIDVAAARGMGIPRSQTGDNLDVEIGELSRQNGMRIADLGDLAGYV